jgi:hypothetical protein
MSHHSWQKSTYLGSINFLHFLDNAQDAVGDDMLVQACPLCLAGEEHEARPEATGEDRGLHPRSSYFHPHVLQHGSLHSLHFDLHAQSHPCSEGALWKMQQATNSTDSKQSGGRLVLRGTGGAAEILRVRDRGGI